MTRKQQTVTVRPGDLVDACTFPDCTLWLAVEVVAVTPEVCFVRGDDGKVRPAFWHEVSIPARPPFPIDEAAADAAREFEGCEGLAHIYMHDAGFRVEKRQAFSKNRRSQIFIGPRLAELIEQANEWERAANAETERREREGGA